MKHALRRSPRPTPATPLALLALVLGASLAGCDGESVPTRRASVPGPAPEAATAATVQPTAPPTAEPSAAAPTEPTNEERRRRFVARVEGLSEPDAEFFSDNLVSNETSFLHVADELPSLAPHRRAYVGVGPEQNFSYLALVDPSVAYIVDIRRDNLRLHLLYKAAFQVARSRAHFVSLMLGRPTPEAQDDVTASVADVLAAATRAPATEASFAEAHTALLEALDGWGLTLGKADRARIDAIHRSLFEGQLELRFALKESNGRQYPTLREMLSAGAQKGGPRGFLARDDTFRRVQRLEAEHRVIPVVGDFAGDKALPGLATALREDGEQVGTFYVSNVEQYLFEPGVWAKWRRNVAALPKAEGAVFVRAWLDQGRGHPRQAPGHRTATVVASMDRFESAQRERSYGTWWAVANDGLLDVAPAGADAGE